MGSAVMPEAKITLDGLLGTYGNSLAGELAVSDEARIDAWRALLSFFDKGDTKVIKNAVDESSCDAQKLNFSGLLLGAQVPDKDRKTIEIVRPVLESIFYIELLGISGDDRYHSYRVAQVSEFLASVLKDRYGFAYLEPRDVGWRTLLHDAGKLRHTLNELADKRKYEKGEKNTLRDEHEQRGRELLDRLGVTDLMLCAIVGNHHHADRYIGEEIFRTTAYIVGCADMFDGAITQRRYKQTLTTTEVIGDMDLLVVQKRMKPEIVMAFKENIGGIMLLDGYSNPKRFRAEQYRTIFGTEQPHKN